MWQAVMDAQHACMHINAMI